MLSKKPMSSRMRSRCQDMRSRCQIECEADVKTNAEPMSRWCEADVKTKAKPRSRRMRSRCREYEADVKTNAKPMSRRMRSRCHDECEADGKTNATNAKPMSRYCEADVKANAKPMSRMLSQADICIHRHARGMQVQTQTNWRQIETRRQISSCLCLHCLLAFLRVLDWTVISTIKRRFPFQCQTRFSWKVHPSAADVKILVPKWSRKMIHFWIDF